ncbi:MAG: hypothetical protein M1818_005812 [Claussenomyces sp. TS43310]|nr:MAG: hypothetical protein M1818_005812 [Claussenomyces sp. TS43310]
MDISSAPFEYKPLPIKDSIRLLQVISRDSGGNIKCIMDENVPKQSCGYLALSYTWGSAKAEESIELNGRRFEVRQNLWELLFHMPTSPFYGAWLWVDAICINQEDPEERERQVRLMPMIYREAQMVLIALGTATRTFEDHARHDFAMYELFKKKYWTRTWIIQEVGNAEMPRVIYISKDHRFPRSMYVIEWKDFMRLMTEYRGVENDLPWMIAQTRENRIHGRQELHKLLKLHHGSMCQERRDKIYGLVGLASDFDDDTGFPFDYKKPLFQVFADVAIYLQKLRRTTSMRHNYYINILEICKDLDRTIGPLDVEEADHQDRSGVDGSIDITGPRILEVFALLYGRIESLGPSYRDLCNRDVSEEWKNYIMRRVPINMAPLISEQNEYFLKDIQSLDPSSEDKIFALKPTVSWTWARPKALRRSRRKYVKNAVKHGINRSLTGAPSSAGFQYVNRPTDKPTTPKSTLAEASLCLLSKGNDDWHPSSIGLVPPNARVGDFIFRAHGLAQAIVLRHTKLRGSNWRYELIGSASLAAEVSDYQDRLKKNAEREAEKRLETGKRSLKQKKKEEDEVDAFGICDFNKDETRCFVKLFMDVVTGYRFSKWDFAKSPGK